LGWFLLSGGDFANRSVAIEAPANAAVIRPSTISALGRIEPKDGVIRVAGPSQPAVVIGKLFIDHGDVVQTNQILALLDNHAVLRANVARLEAELRQTEADRRRHQQLRHDGIVSESEIQLWESKTDIVKAELQRARAELELSEVRSPIDGRVLDIHARAGERVGPSGIAELGRTDRAYAIAEVYETDIERVKVGQRATVTSPALGEPVHGTVERIRPKVAKRDILDTDPAARIDARVIEVEVLLDSPEPVAGLVNLQVEVTIAGDDVAP